MVNRVINHHTRTVQDTRDTSVISNLGKTSAKETDTLKTKSIYGTDALSRLPNTDLITPAET